MRYKAWVVSGIVVMGLATPAWAKTPLLADELRRQATTQQGRRVQEKSWDEFHDKAQELMERYAKRRKGIMQECQDRLDALQREKELDTRALLGTGGGVWSERMPAEQPEFHEEMQQKRQWFELIEPDQQR